MTQELHTNVSTYMPESLHVMSIYYNTNEVELWFLYKIRGSQKLLCL